MLETVDQQTYSEEALLAELKKAGVVWLEGEYTIVRSALESSLDKDLELERNLFYGSMREPGCNRTNERVREHAYH